MRSFVFVLVVLLSGSCFAQERYPLWFYRDYGSYSSRYSASPPVLYSYGGRYLGELSENKYRPDSVSNPYGRYGSKHSPDSINNPHTMHGRYRFFGQVYVYPGW